MDDVQVRDAILKMTKTELELTLDPDMYIFFEKGTGGGISYTFYKFSEGNKK